MGNHQPSLDREGSAERCCDCTEQQHAKRCERCLRSCCSTRVRSVFGVLNGLVTRPFQFRLRVVELLGRLVVADLHLSRHDVDNPLLCGGCIRTTAGIGR